MRLVIDSLIALMLVWIFGAVLFHYREEQTRLMKHQKVHQSLAAMQEQALLHGALGEVETSAGRFPLEIAPAWFSNRPPINVMITGRHPWLDIAPPADHSDHPPDPVITRAEQAGFWYNPNRGIFRARVMPQFTEEETLTLYNQLNGASLRWMPRNADEAVKPHPANLLATTTRPTAKDPATPRTSLVDSPQE